MISATVLAIACGFSAEELVRIDDAQHVQVYYRPGRFGGWPANHGIWSWGNEILVGFTDGLYKDLGERHNIDREAPEIHYLARSLDGGVTWQISDPAKQGDLIPEGGFLHGIPRTDVTPRPLMDCPGGVPFTHPDFTMTVRTNDINAGISRFWYSTDRGRDWDGPYRLPDFGYPGTAARTDYVVEGPETCTLFITAAKKSNSEEGVPICVRTIDGGKTWNLISQLGDEPEGFSIMPASVKLDEDSYYVAVRRREDDRRWIAAWRSDDHGATWKAMPDPVESCGVGNPPALIRLEDGRLCITWGYRGEPYSIRARISGDEGRTWGPILVLRDDGSSVDIGYPRMVQRPDGKVVTLYYFSDEKTGRERYLAATIWTPPAK